MFILRLFFMLFIVFVVLMAAVAASLWVKVKMHLQNPFLRETPDFPMRQDDKVIEGEYKVLGESQKDKGA